MDKRGQHNPQQGFKSNKLEDKIIENIVELQKIQTNMAEKFDKLSSQISSLLGLFEMAAKSFATNPAMQVSDKDREFLEKIDKLLEQNKTIAKGLTLMEERVRERVSGQPSPQEEKPALGNKIDDNFKPSISKPLPKF